MRSQGDHGVLGVPGLEASPSPVAVPGLWGVAVVQVAAGEAHCIALGACGGVWSWGRGKHGALGHGGVRDEDAPRQVRRLRLLVHSTCGDACVAGA